MTKRYGGKGGVLKRHKEPDEKVDSMKRARSETKLVLHSPSPSVSEEDDEEGTENESMGSDVEEPILGDLIVEGENEDEAFDTDYEDHIDSSKSTISMTVHLGRVITQAEADELAKKKWKFEWKVPAVDMPMTKWVGTGECFLKEVSESSDYGLKLKFFKHWLDVYNSSGGKEFHSSRRRLFFSLCNSYRDILHCNKRPFYRKGLEEDSSIMDGYIMHALNHVFRTRELVTKNEAKLAKLPEINKEESSNEGGFLDHGFTRPKVLILLPMASIAFRVVKRLIQLTPLSHKNNVEHKDRFYEDFGTEEVKNNDDDEEIPIPQKSSKPSDFDILFGGNNNDHFMIGIKFTRRSIKLYSDFYSSDMIIASPLGIVTKIGQAEFDKEKDVDYLSSIEVLIVDHADVISMQNWSHVNSVVEKLNQIPSKQHGTDVMRIRQWYLDGHAKFYRQTIVLGSFLNPDMNALFNHHCLNYQGKVKSVTEFKGVLPRVLLQVRQIYERFDAASIVDADDARLDYFVKKVFPKIKDSVLGGTMLFINSYFEFVRIRNFLKAQNSSFCLLGEYTKQSDISRARVWFFEGKRKIMLYTERSHFYHRYKIRGMKNLIIYSLPERKEFYPEVMNMLEGSDDLTCTVLFSRFDQLRLERVVGTTPAKRMMSSDKGDLSAVTSCCMQFNAQWLASENGTSLGKGYTEESPEAILKAQDGSLSLKTNEETLDGFSHIMFATGRRPNTKVDEYSRTSVPYIWAVDDATDRLNLTPVAWGSTDIVLFDCRGCYAGCLGLLLETIQPFLLGSSSLLSHALQIVEALGAYRLSSSELRVLVRYILQMRLMSSGHALVAMMERLVHMEDITTQNVSLAPYVEMDMSKFGHASFQVSLGDRSWPPAAGYSFVCWFQYRNFLKAWGKESDQTSKTGPSKRRSTGSKQQMQGHVLRLFSVGSPDDGNTLSMQSFFFRMTVFLLLQPATLVHIFFWVRIGTVTPLLSNVEIKLGAEENQLQKTR
ncbi:hypothetical protein IFM89_002306 [Coptis chinensis]|uniref:U3 small nucleolar RNA-associated protein 25 n=1 Tax=Coptis chinensis TaxID=261450 RepID=A0A835MCD8_9MAGN|nr:hypothetical protein IFM89_002306 [Coptis chinensis]